MTAENFCYWLKGYFEINGNQPRPPEYVDSLNSEQIKMIKQHLDYVFATKAQPQKVSMDKTMGILSGSDMLSKIDLTKGGMITC